MIGPVTRTASVMEGSVASSHLPSPSPRAPSSPSSRITRMPADTPAHGAASAHRTDPEKIPEVPSPASCSTPASAETPGARGARFSPSSWLRSLTFYTEGFFKGTWWNHFCLLNKHSGQSLNSDLWNVGILASRAGISNREGKRDKLLILDNYQILWNFFWSLFICFYCRAERLNHCVFHEQLIHSEWILNMTSCLRVIRSFCIDRAWATSPGFIKGNMISSSPESFVHHVTAS